MYARGSFEVLIHTEWICIVTQQVDATLVWIKMLLAEAFHWLIFHVAFFVFAEA